MAAFAANAVRAALEIGLGESCGGGPDGEWAEEVVVMVSQPTRAEVGPERLAAIAISCRRAQFSVARTAAADTVVTRVRAEGMWPIQRTVRLERLDITALLAGELQLLGRDTTAPYAMTWSGAPIGTHALKVVAVDNRKASTASNVVSISKPAK